MSDRKSPSAKRRIGSVIAAISSIALLSSIWGVADAAPNGTALAAAPAQIGHPKDPGQVTLSKTATPVDGLVNTWDITLHVEGKDVKETTSNDIVLVIDTSGSMNENNKMADAKNAATNFIGAMLPSENTRIAVVSYAKDATRKIGLTSDEDRLKTVIDGLWANGGTNTQAGVRAAENLLADSDADNKHIILLSDGEPTYGFGINNPQDYLQPYSADPDSEGETTTEVPYNDFNPRDTWGAGNNLRERRTYTTIEQVWSDKAKCVDWYWLSCNEWEAGLVDREVTHVYYYNSGNSAIAEAGFAKGAGDRLWSIYVGNDATGISILKTMASEGSFYPANSSGELAGIFENIASQISAAVTNATVSDPMGQGFEIPADQIGNWTVEGTTNQPTYTDGTLSWNPGTLITPIAEGSDIKYAQLTYRVTLNDGILSATPNSNGEYPTNGDATITYTDANSDTQTGHFVSPKVNPVLYTVTKKVLDAAGEERYPNQDFVANVTDSGNGDGYNRNYTLNPGEGNASTRLITDLRHLGNYTVTETGDLGDYDVTYQMRGETVEGDSVTFSPTANETNDYAITIINAPAHGTLAITKILANSFPAKLGTTTFSGTYTCTVESTQVAAGTWKVDGAGSATLTKTTGAEPNAIPVNATCTVAENKPTDTPAYTWDTPTMDYGTQGATSVTITKDATATVTVYNDVTKNPGALTWSKVDADNTNQLLGGSEWTITDPENVVSVITDCVADADHAADCTDRDDTAIQDGRHFWYDKDPAAGKFKLAGLPWGTYTVTETKAPSATSWPISQPTASSRSPLMRTPWTVAN